MKISIVCIGKLKEQYLKDAVMEYSKRLSKFCNLEIIELNDDKTKEGASVKENEIVLLNEANRIISKLDKKSLIIAMDINAKQYSSNNHADLINESIINGYDHITYIIGGSLGLSKIVKDIANVQMSFGKITMPHQLFRVILLEQIYRSFKIINNEPYHK